MHSSKSVTSEWGLVRIHFAQWVELCRKMRHVRRGNHMGAHLRFAVKISDLFEIGLRVRWGRMPRGLPLTGMVA